MPDAMRTPSRFLFYPSTIYNTSKNKKHREYSLCGTALQHDTNTWRVIAAAVVLAAAGSIPASAADPSVVVRRTALAHADSASGAFRCQSAPDVLD